MAEFDAAMAARRAQEANNNLFTNTAADDLDLDLDLTVYDRYARRAVVRQTEDDILDQYRPRHRSEISSISATRSLRSNLSSLNRPQDSYNTPATSIAIHVQQRLQNRRGGSINATLGTTSEEESFLWGIGSFAGEPASGEFRNVQTFANTYFETLPIMSRWRRIALSFVGLIFLLSAVHLGYTFIQVCRLGCSPNAAQVKLLFIMVVWWFCAAADGILRFREREKIGVSMIAAGIIPFVLSHFVQFLAE